MRFFAMVGVLVWSILASHPAKADAVSDVLGCSEDPCVVHYNPGGEIKRFQMAAWFIIGSARSLVIIDGDCISACTILADMARDRVCITPRARFGFHKAFRSMNLLVAKIKVDLSDPPIRADINSWVMERGGYPADDLRFMPYDDALKIWKKCKTR